MGISGQFLKKISEPFTQENANSTHGGSGLGMSIIKSYLDILKGTIVIDSELGVGTKVLVRIPVHKSDYKKVIVVIEDNYANSFILKEMITEVTDYLVEIYEDGQVYIDNLEKQQPLLIFMDLHMPRLDGVDTTKYLRENGYTCPIVAVTANNLKSEKVRGYDAGITDFIIKPVSVSNIKDCLVRHIK
jgi:CheY-like chemotaxis protein